MADYFEKRKGQDKWIRIMKFFGLISWSLFVITFYLIGKAQPQLESFFEKWLDVKVREGWNERLLFYSFVLALVIFYFSSFALIINTRRHKRKSDKYSRALIFLLLSSLAGIVIYLLK